MYLLPELAVKIVREVEQVLAEEIIVVDTEGIIIASTENNRIGSFHEGAYSVIKTADKLYIDDQLAQSLEGVRVGINMPIIFNSSVIGVIGITGQPRVVEPFAEIIRKMTELIIQEAYYSQQLEWKTRGLESFFYEWVNSKDIDADFLERGRMLGVPVDRRHVCCLLQIDDGSLNSTEADWIQRDLFDLFRQFFTREDDLIIRWGQGRYLLLKSCGMEINREQMTYLLGELQRSFQYKYDAVLYAGIGKTIGTTVIEQSYKEAKKALKVAQKKNHIIFYEDLMLEVVLEEVPVDMQQEFVNRILGPLMGQEDLIETIRMYIRQNQSIKKTAEQLHLHINSLHYRLNQIRQLTGIDPKETEGLVLYYLAINFYGVDKGD